MNRSSFERTQALCKSINDDGTVTFSTRDQKVERLKVLVGDAEDWLCDALNASDRYFCSRASADIREAALLLNEMRKVLRGMR